MPTELMANGMKPIEAFENDIWFNLLKWCPNGNSIFYETYDYWYQYFWDGKIIRCARHRKLTDERIETWMNLHSCSVGKDWLKKPMQKKKRTGKFFYKRK